MIRCRNRDGGTRSDERDIIIDGVLNWTVITKLKENLGIGACWLEGVLIPLRINTTSSPISMEHQQ